MKPELQLYGSGKHAVCVGTILNTEDEDKLCGLAPAVDDSFPVSVCLHQGVEVGMGVAEGRSPKAPGVCWFPEPTEGAPADQEWTRNFILNIVAQSQIEVPLGLLGKMEINSQSEG